MSSLFNLPPDVWRFHITPFLLLREFVRLDGAVMNRAHRFTFHNSISNARHKWHVCADDKALKWFGARNLTVDSLFFGKVKQSPFASTLRNLTGRHKLHCNRIFEHTIQSQGSVLTSLTIATDDINDISGLRFANCLAELSVSHCGNVTSDTFIRAIKACTNLRVCSVLYCKLLGEAAMAAIVEHCKELEELTLSEPCQPDTIFIHITEPVKLRKFVCYHPFALITGPFLNTIANYMPYIEHLEWSSSNRSTFSAVHFEKVVQNCVKLQTIEIDGRTPLTDHSIQRIAQSLSSLCHLNLGRCEQVTSTSIITLAQGCHLLEHLNLSTFPAITDTALQAVGTYCRLLTTINVQYCTHLTDNGFSTLNVAILRVLYLSGTNITGTLVSYLILQGTQLTTLLCNSCPNLHINLLPSLSPQNTVRYLTLGELMLTNAEWLQLSLLFPSLHQLTIESCSNIDVTVLRSFIEHSDGLYSMQVHECSIPTLAAKELQLWWKARVGAVRKTMLIVTDFDVMLTNLL